MRFRTIVAGVAAGVAAAGASTAAQALTPVQAETYLAGFTRPLGFVQHPTDPDVQFVVEQGGLIHRVESGVVSGIFLDVSSRIGTSADERGLLGLAFPPNYPDDPCFYINYTDDSDDTIIARYQHAAGDPLTGDFNSEEIILTIDQPFSNHNGGHLAFGPDGMLYVSSGDGGFFNDPGERAQDTSNLLGAILRLDVSGGPGSGYTAPPDNPFVGQPGRDEIWSYGLRNPWRFTFDQGPSATGAMLIADVGQDAREEVNYEPPGAGGRNYGWDCMEGFICGNTNDAGCLCGDAALTRPIHDVAHPTGGSITGGHVYRGAQMPKNRGRYFFADFLTQRVWSLGLAIDENGEATVDDIEEHTDELSGGGSIWVPVSSFGRDAAGELYAVDYGGGVVHRITGVFEPADVNCDGVVDGADLGVLLLAWGPGATGAADLDNNGAVDGADLGLLLLAWDPG